MTSVSGAPLVSGEETPARPTGRESVLAVTGLLVVTASWGSTFFLIKDLVTRVPVPDFLALRFAVATAALALVAWPAVRRLSAGARLRGVVLGLLYGLAQILQTEGLAHTAASVSGFVTGMYVVLTPVFAGLLLRHRIGVPALCATGLATAGLAVLSLRGFAFGHGELLTLASAALYALHIVALGAWTNQRDALGLSVVQVAVISCVCALAALPGGITVPSRGDDWLALLYMALMAGAFALVTQTWAQAHLSPTRSAVIMCAEPVWAALFAVVFGGEQVTLRMVAGGGLILTAMYTSELGNSRPQRDAQPSRSAPSET
ncbi:drug/metabolite transporter (DMT)-like permease [Thermasporomyces composti]|uniref:Drug/metabolite transporter (DMT)-like permease n=1 Tax=Thermasporomyces composti TaxID=696763 RepID=A0A3D9UZZ0_THECX|nr:drug/metabolite transporter (DMT)-like permease [Thermasporomyces composti]